jgi:hypothetical protein
LIAVDVVVMRVGGEDATRFRVAGLIKRELSASLVKPSPIPSALNRGIDKALNVGCCVCINARAVECLGRELRKALERSAQRRVVHELTDEVDVADWIDSRITKGVIGLSGKDLAQRIRQTGTVGIIR